MPTGYTNAILEGCTFQEFVWRCARNFGALIMMRDGPIDAPIKQQEVDSYYTESLVRAEDEYVRFNKLSQDELKAEYLTYAKEQDADRAKAESKRLEEKDRYLEVLNHVTTWTPPTPEHQGLKDFMIQQINESIRFDCGDMSEYYETLSYDHWLTKKSKDVKWQLQYHREALEKQKTLVAGRNQWINALHNSVPMPNVSTKDKP